MVNKQMNNKINAVIIDTSSYYKNQCDFAGINKSIIPMLLRLLEANNIILLTHPILDYEIRKHIKDSSLIKRANELQALIKKCKDQLALLNIHSEELVEKVNELKIEKRLIDGFSSFYKRAVSLPYVDAKSIFDDYFKERPPFSSTGKKKSEFPDAFILKGLMEYCKDNVNSCILVISDDSDWKKAVTGNEQIIQVDTLESAMVSLWNQLEDKTDLFRMLVSKVKNELCSEIADTAASEAFCIDSIDTADEIDITNVSVTTIDDEIVPLEANKDSVLLQLKALLSVDGNSEYLDENRSMWDSEDKCYYFLAYTYLEFQNASAEIDCEVRINFADDGSFTSISLDSVRTINEWDISLDLEDAEISEQDVTDYGEDDYLAEQAETLED